MAKTLTLQELRDRDAEMRASWAKVPTADLLEAIGKDLSEVELEALAKLITPLVEALPKDERARDGLVGLLNLINNLPNVIASRIVQLRADDELAAKTQTGE